MIKKIPKKYLEDFLRVAPLSHALWRSIEALSFSQEQFTPPVLDIGCGFGEFAGVVFDKVEVGIDISSKDLERALKGKKYVKVQWADARDLPFKAASFGTVTSVSVMEHIKNSEDVIREVSRVLKRGGVFIFTVPTPEMKKHLLVPHLAKMLGFDNLGERYFSLHKKAFKHVYLKPKNWWLAKLEKEGFEVEKCHGTLSRTALRIHEFFLISAFPSQLGKLFFGKRFMMSTGLRSRILPVFFSRFIKTDEGSDINLFFVARKK